MAQTYSTQRTQTYESVNVEPQPGPELLHIEPDRIPADKLLIDEDSSVKGMRWEANKLIKKYMILYSGYFDEKGEDGQYYFVKKSNWPATLKFYQTLQIVQYLTAVVNSITSLANTYDHAQANAYTETYASSLRHVIFGSADWDGVPPEIKGKVYREIVNLTSIQMNRGYKSNESKLSNTQIVQQEGTQRISEEQTINTRNKGFKLSQGVNA